MMTKEKEDLELEDFEVDHFKSLFQQPKWNSPQAMSRKNPNRQENYSADQKIWKFLPLSKSFCPKQPIFEQKLDISGQSFTEISTTGRTCQVQKCRSNSSSV